MINENGLLSEDKEIKLNELAKKVSYSSGVMSPAIQYCFRILKRHLAKGDSILELGPAEGLMTELLARTDSELTVVEGSSVFCENLKERFQNIKVVHSLFENFEASKQYNMIVLGHVLEHVADPVSILRRLSSSLRSDGRIFAAVPNARSLHRQAAVTMGLLPREDSLNCSDRRHGHQIVFDPESFRSIFMQAGFSIDIFGGYWLKPISNQQIEDSWTPSMIEAFMQLGERYPDIAGEIYILASKRGGKGIS